MLVRNHFTHDARVHHEARTLADAGWRVVVLARPGAGLPAREARNGFLVRRPDAWRPRLMRGAEGIGPAATRTRSGDSGDAGDSAPPPAPPNAAARWRALLWKLRWEVALVAAAGRERADVYHAHELNTLFEAFLAARRRRAGLVYDAHELQVEVPVARGARFPRLVRLGRRLLERLLIKSAAAVIDSSPARARALVRNYSITPPALILNAPPRRARTPAVDLRRRFAIASDALVAVYQGDLTPEKGIERVIETWARVEGAVLLVLGDGPIRAELEARAALLGVAERIRFAGRIPRAELLDHTAGADLGLCLMDRSNLSHYTSLPNKLFEFMAVGVAIIALDAPEIGRVLRETGAGELVDSDHPGELAAAIERLLRNPERLRELGDRGWRAAQSTYCWEPQAERLLALYSELAPSAEALPLRGT